MSLKLNVVLLPSQIGGDVSPTGIADFPTSWAWHASEPPVWYNKGADVDELLNEAEALDWLADSGDLTESYTPPPEDINMNNDVLQLVAHSITGNEIPTSKLSEPSLLSLTGENSNQPNIAVRENSNHVTNPVHNHPTGEMAPSVPNFSGPATQEVKVLSPTPSSLNMPPLPSFFESDDDLTTMKKSNTKPSLNNLSSVSLFSSASEAADAVSSSDLLLEQFDEQAFVTALLDQDSNNNLLNHH